MSELFAFPNPVNEKAARVVAGVVAATSLAILLTGWHWLLVPLAYGFLARVATGPTLSPLGRVSMRVVAPRLGEPKYVPGPPKRFAQAIGAICTTLAAIFALGLGWTLAADLLVGMVLVFATLESVVAFCAGCTMFAALMRVGVIPQETCEACANVWARTPEAA